MGFLWWLLRHDPAKQSKTSLALWVPLIWIFIVGSRLPSQWLGYQMGFSATDASTEGNSFDRIIYFALIFLALGILKSRGFNWGDFLARNSALAALLAFGLISVLWSDFPFVSFKRWFRDLGNYLVILVVLSDPDAKEAVCTLLRRLCYLLIPTSLLLIKYYPNLGKQYEFWSGASMFVGVTTSKNMLGVACMVSGIFFFWDTVMRWSDRRNRRNKQTIILNLLFIVLTLWVLNLSNSATSRVCLVLGCLVIAAARRKGIKRNPFLLKVLIPVCLCLYMVLQYGFGINGALAGMVGRDPTLTGRTVIWDAVLSIHTNPLLGTGYESFWLGPRLTKVWLQTGVGINEAHNGYLEVYLNLGLIGLFLLVAFLISSYRTICRRLETSPDIGSLTLALWSVLPFYNVTEAAFKGQLIWVIFLFGAIATPQALSARSIPAPGESLIEEPQSKVPETITV